MYLHRLFTLVFVCLLIPNMYAQLSDSYVAATVITSDNTQLSGFVLLKDLEQLSKEICFKQNINDVQCTRYARGQLKSFRTENGNYYELMDLEIKNKSMTVTVIASQLLKGETELFKAIYDSELLFIVVSKGDKRVLQNDDFIPGELEIKRNNFQGVLNIITEGFSMANYPRLTFNENEIIEALAAYNTSIGSDCKRVKKENKLIPFYILNVGAGAGKRQSEFFTQAMYRLYYPEISEKMSLNLGLSYYNYQTSYASALSANGFKESLLSMPLQIQHNFLTKKFRPYIFGGISLNYLKIVDKNNRLLNDTGFQKNFGIGFLYGGGLELDIYKHIMLKSEYRFELYNHLLLFSIGYNFSK